MHNGMQTTRLLAREVLPEHECSTFLAMKDTRMLERYLELFSALGSASGKRANGAATKGLLSLV